MKNKKEEKEKEENLIIDALGALIRLVLDRGGSGGVRPTLELLEEEEENAENLIKEEGRGEKEAYGNKNRHYFFIPKEARWSVLSQTSENIDEKIDCVCSIIERENPDLDGVLTTTTYNDKRKYPDDRLRKLISHSSSMIIEIRDNKKISYTGR